jgi:hypothetical protein
MMQFSTRTLFVIMSASAGLAWVFFAPPQWVGLLVLYLIYLLLPATTLTGIIYHRGAWQAFFVGAAPWVVTIAIIIWLMLLDGFPRMSLGSWFDFPSANAEELMLFKLWCGVPIALTAASGVMGVVIRTWAVRLQTRQSTGQGPPA